MLGMFSSLHLLATITFIVVRIRHRIFHPLSDKARPPMAVASDNQWNFLHMIRETRKPRSKSYCEKPRCSSYAEVDDGLNSVLCGFMQAL